MGCHAARGFAAYPPSPRATISLLALIEGSQSGGAAPDWHPAQLPRRAAVGDLVPLAQWLAPLEHSLRHSYLLGTFLVPLRACLESQWWSAEAGNMASGGCERHHLVCAGVAAAARRPTGPARWECRGISGTAVNQMKKVQPARSARWCGSSLTWHAGTYAPLACECQVRLNVAGVQTCRTKHRVQIQWLGCTSSLQWSTQALRSGRGNAALSTTAVPVRARRRTLPLLPQPRGRAVGAHTSLA